MEFIVTGTHAYGPVTDGSDLDIVMMLEGGQKLANFLEKHNINLLTLAAGAGKEDLRWVFIRPLGNKDADHIRP